MTEVPELPEAGKPDSIPEALDRVAESCLGFLAAYIGAQRNPVEDEPNAYLWAGTIHGALSHLYELTYREEEK